LWHPDPVVFITNALSPAQVLNVKMADEEEAIVVVPDNQLSLAIGKEGQNVRLAAKLTGRRIDIKSASEAEAEAQALPAEPEEAPVAEEEVTEEEIASELPGEEPSTESAEAAEIAAETAEPVAAEIEAAVPVALETPAEKTRIKFAEDMRFPAPTKPGTKTKKKKKSSSAKSNAEDGIKIKKRRRAPQGRGVDKISEYDEEY